MALIKLKISAFSDPECVSGATGSFDAMFNPSTLTRSYEVKYYESNVIGENDVSQIFAGMAGDSMSIKLLADGTGVVPLPSGATNVDDYIDKIKKVIYSYQGDKHRPNILKVEWGSIAFICICKKIEIKSTLFNEDGSILRAEIGLSLSKSVDFKTKAKEAKKNSPDLTHVRTVKAGDSLPLMTYRIYGDSSYYLEVARINNLRSVQDIKPGDQVYFPPLKK